MRLGMMKHLMFCVLALTFSACSQSSSTGGTQQTADGQAAAPAAQKSLVHFFSVAWGCVEVEQARLDASSYTIKDFETKTGACPETLAVLNATARQLLRCPVVIGPKAIPATYILFDKRTLDGNTVRDLRAEGFTEDNFCPAVAERTFN